MSAKATPHLDYLTKFRINGVLPFCGTAEDIADQCHSQAYALCEMMADAIDPDPESNKGPINPQVLRGAFMGIGTLIALADFAFNGEWSK